MAHAADSAALYELLPRKQSGFFVVALASNSGNVQYRSTIKQNCVDWMDDNQPKPAAERLNEQAAAPVWRHREAA